MFLEKVYGDCFDVLFCQIIYSYILYNDHTIDLIL